MNKNTTQLFLALIFGMIGILTYGQYSPNFPGPTQFQPGIQNNIQKSHTPPNPMDMVFGTGQQSRIQQQNERLIREAEIREKQRIEAQRLFNAKLNKAKAYYGLGLPSKKHIPETQYYQKAFDSLTKMSPDEFSIKKATFLIENAFYEEQRDYKEFEKLIKQTGDFLREKMDEFGYDKNSNLAKNFMLFQFFSDTLEIKSKNLKHLPFTYDFEDYSGNKDWTKMFVTKLLATGSGQCNSLPRLYLILAEEIGAEAFLSTSPNHTYIKFRDEDENWYNLELTNGMFTTDTFILQSGFIKSEALQNGIYMETLSNRELMSLLLSDFAMGYIHKFGYSPFIKQVADSALELSPNQLSANMVNSDYLTAQFGFAARRAGITLKTRDDLKKIRYHPPLVAMFNERNAQYQKIDKLGYEYMSAKEYEKWLNSLQDEKQKQENKSMKHQFNLKLNQPIKD